MAVTQEQIQDEIARRQQQAAAVREQPQISAIEPTARDRFSQFGERVSRAIGLEGEPIFQPGPIGAFAAKKGREIKAGVKEEGPLFIGETIGEFAGSKFGAKGRIAGAGIGRATGESFKQIGQAIINSPNAPASSKDAALRLLKEAAIGAGTEAVSEGAVKAFRRLGTTLGFKSTVVKPLPDFDDVQKLARNIGIDLTPAQRSASRAVDTFEEIAENAFFGRGKLRDIKQITQPAGIRRGVDRLLDSFLPKARRVGRGELGEILSDTIAEKNTAFRKAGAAIYKRVDRLNKGATVNLSSLKAFATRLQQRRIKEGGLAQPIDTVIEDLLKRPDITDFSTAHRIRSSLLEVARNAPSKKDRIVGITKQASKLVDNQMTKASKSLSPDAFKMWRAADGFWRGGKQVFNSKVIRRVTKSVLDDTPDKVLDVIFQAKSPKQIRTVMSLADPLTKKRLRFAFLDNMLEKSTRQIPGDISDLRTLLGRNFLEKFDAFGDEALSAIFSQEEKQRIRNLARLAKTTQGKTGGAGGFLIQLIQAAPLGATATGIVAGQPELAKKGLITGIPVAGFTAGLSALIRSKRGSKILTDLIDVPRGTQNIAALSARLTRELARIKLEERKSKQGPKQAIITGTRPN
ncbi:hypothetical protein LCGC14_0362200 [marine sediment metagenome]|uniref:Uncharacterized protein n=1 Tax=marine sediment metagenome TaxID=412755 RepID=A0A0F9TQK8_9ZZZZ